MTRLIIGFTGEAGSGKDAVARHIKEKYGASIFMFSTPLRDLLTRLHLPITRGNLASLSLSLRTLFGEDLFGTVVTEDIKAYQGDLTIVTGIRRTEDIERLKQAGDFRLIYVESLPEVRYARIHKRSQNEDDTTKTFEEFQKDGELETERTIRGLKSKASTIVENNSSFEDLYRACDAFMEKLLHA
jgi:dephospho-CoA kinase